jgi:hypothetical protein
MPKSALSSTQLPFLNRFEKYILSVEDALQEKLQGRQWLQIQVNEANVKQKNVFNVLEEGCNDMIERLHVGSLQNRLLYGLVPRETVASFLYTVVERSVETASSAPEIPPPFMVKTVERAKPAEVVEVKEEKQEEEDVVHQEQVKLCKSKA